MTTPDRSAGAELIRAEPGVALWRRIVHVIEAEITDGTHPPGAKLPTEAQFSARFGVNRHTVRRALEELSRSGLVRVEQGRGSFVAEDVLDYAVAPRTRFSEWIRRHNKEPSGRILDLREIAADATVAAGLGIRTGARVIRLERLGMADGRPVSLGTHHFPAARFPGLLAALQSAVTITEALARAGVSDYRRQVTRVTARLPQPNEAELLRTPRNRPLLITENVNVDQNGAVVEFGVSRYPTPRVQIVFEP
ncbi:phosphonate metabolism transcriptional regulator PhnF [Limobrevibacterium gyesilva]|uniref:Phosphonate metabolism transcriptional regulator PhnF n=1 Tax=Limobrevibacterium gyesilva TaxID=2991712 RepID=A0AA42CID0_9PROT|nr:phosphonate metabolism transcriptional regulator PhnF [Limobrevibacterium gyesilva]MCW3475760.1 phosphonate metabolism transcriptional regulator PhnF [Limobrevibacterium gyesilva]